MGRRERRVLRQLSGEPLGWRAGWEMVICVVLAMGAAIRGAIGRGRTP